MEYAVAFLLGLVLGSFYNVLIYRLPRNISVLFPRSHCPECKAKIRWHDNIPLISYILLGGKCRNCGTKISIQYPLVELSSGLLAVISLALWGASPEAVVYYFFFSALLVASLIDLKFFILPDSITIPGTVLGFGSSFLREDITPIDSFIGLVAGALIPSLIYLYYIKVRKIEGLGLGDIKLLAFIGAVTGVYGVLSALMLGSMLGLVFVLPVLFKNRNLQFVIPFGPFLSLGCFVGVLFKEPVMEFLFIRVS